MSSPIAIPRSTSWSSLSSSAASVSTTPSSPGLYVPVHKRSGSSSRASSPSSARFPSPSDKVHSRIYTADFLLSLRPQADESLKEKMKAACPEVVMNRKTRKSLEFLEHQRVKAASGHAYAQPHAHSSTHQHQALPTTPTPLPLPAPAPSIARVLPRRNRPAGRGPERRRQVLQSMSATAMNDTWRGMRVTVQPLAVV